MAKQIIIFSTDSSERICWQKQPIPPPNHAAICELAAWEKQLFENIECPF